MKRDESRRDFCRILRRKLTPAEAVLWNAIRNRAIAGWRFRRQHLFDAAVVNFYCPEANVAIEVDGGVHLEQSEYDRRSDAKIETDGVLVLRFWNTEIHHELTTVLERIDQVCRERVNPKNPSPQPLSPEYRGEGSC